ncbi:MAG: hypothetical protein N3E50_08975 [Candidatus Goldbacteria bacterium]|nr:hypothetical protein [Candidatus Goldiibacteriota bacterium]
MKEYINIIFLFIIFFYGCSSGPSKKIIIRKSEELTKLQQIKKDVENIKEIGKLSEIKEEIMDVVKRSEEGIKTGDITGEEANDLIVQLKELTVKISEFNKKIKNFRPPSGEMAGLPPRPPNRFNGMPPGKMTELSPFEDEEKFVDLLKEKVNEYINNDIKLKEATDEK